MRTWMLLICLILILPFISANQFPEPIGYMNDFADMFTPLDEQRIEQVLLQIEKDTTAEVVVVTVDSLGGLTRERYAYDLATEWGIGKAEKDNGLLLLIAKQDREYRFEIGRGLEGTINDAKAGRIGRRVLVPYFKEGNYGEGTYQAVTAIKGFIEDDPSVIAKFEETAEEKFYPFIVLGFVVFLLFLLIFGYIIKNHKYAIWIGGHALALIVAFFMGFSILYAVFIMIMIFWILFGPRGRGGSGYYGGGGHSGGGGFGGFGGGGFGGGGAGGGW